jgi:O-antigen ligase
VTAIAWGVLTFGAVYPWGYWPLAAVCAITGASALSSRRVRAAVPRPLAMALAAVVAAGVLQVISLPLDVLQRISPATTAVLARYDLSVAAGTASWHAVSIDPGRTWVGLILLGSFALFAVGIAGLLDDRLTTRVAQSVLAIGFVVSLIAIMFAGDHSGRVYGFWQPRSPGAPFGPFVNRNHYAGWMLMGTLLGFGYFCALLDSASRVRIRSWRDRVIWLSTSQGARIIAVGAAVATMTLSVLLSMSRAGIGLLALGLFGLGVLRARRTAAGWTRAAFAAAVLALGTASVVWAGPDTLAARFGTWQDDSLRGRLAVWRDAGSLVADFPVLGTGFNTFGVAMLFYQKSNLQEAYTETHNDYLQIASEGGLLIGVPVFALLLTAALEIRRRLKEARSSPTRWIRVGAVAGLLALGLQDLVDFSLQMPGNAALFCVLAAIAFSQITRPSPATA